MEVCLLPKDMLSALMVSILNGFQTKCLENEGTLKVQGYFQEWGTVLRPSVGQGLPGENTTLWLGSAEELTAWILRKI